MAIKSNAPSELTELDREILVMEHTRQLNNQRNALLTARLEIKKAERAVQKYGETIVSLETAIAESEKQISDLT